MSTLALALGAGGARGLAHIHALKALDDLGVKPVLIAGTSIGAILGSAYAAGMSGAEIEDFVLALTSSKRMLLSKAFQSRPDSLRSFRDDGGLRLGAFNLARILTAYLPETIPETFEELAIPLRAAATDYYSETTRIFDSGPLIPALAASSTIPAVFLCANVDGRFYIDGSATDPCPVDTLQGAADHVLAIDVSGGSFGDPTQRPSKIDTVYATSQIMQQTIVRLMVQKYPGTILLRPPVDKVRALDFLKAPEILQNTGALRDDVKRELDAAMG